MFIVLLVFGITCGAGAVFRICTELGRVPNKNKKLRNKAKAAAEKHCDSFLLLYQLGEIVHWHWSVIEEALGIVDVFRLDIQSLLTGLDALGNNFEIKAF